jgi:hypothetical protein
VTSPARAASLRLAAWSIFLVLALRLLHGPAFGRLSVPLGSVGDLAAWTDRTSPAVMALAVVRLGALAAAWYLAGATVLAVIADAAGWRPLGVLAAVVSPRVVRQLACRTAGVGLAAGTLLAVAPLPARVVATPAGASSEPPGSPQPSTEPPDTTATATMTPLPGSALAPSSQPTATMTRIPTTDYEPLDAGPTIPNAEAPADEPAHGDRDETELWIVRSGDSFWSIAEATLAEVTGRRATEHEVRRYWLRLIDANRRRLPDPTNPDLLVPGQRLDVVPPP